MSEIRQFIAREVNKKYPDLEEINDEDLIEFLTFDCKKVEERDHDEHRWYNLYNSVHEIITDDGPRYFEVPCVSHKSECQDDDDIGFKVTIERGDYPVREVFPISTTTYR